MQENKAHDATPNGIAVIGDLDSIIGFMAVGFDVRECSSAEEARTALLDCAKSCAIIFISEKYARQIEDTLNSFSSSPFPAVIPLPTESGTDGWSADRLKRIVEKAVGSNII
ncbi:MAG: V-type ATP synthase subunit F [Eubacteriales bacterium]|jgi:V/A-type H+-transporting ATPase subunit F